MECKSTGIRIKIFSNGFEIYEEAAQGLLPDKLPELIELKNLDKF